MSCSMLTEIKQLSSWMEINPMTYGECIIPIIAASHSVGIFTHAHMVAHATYCASHTQRQTVLCCCELHWGACWMMHIRLISIHSSMDLQHSLTLISHLLIACFSSTMSQAKRFKNTGPVMMLVSGVRWVGSVSTKDLKWPFSLAGTAAFFSY